MSHIGDTNKMVDTPRTDAHNWHDGDYDDPLHAFADFARILERELNAANIEIEEKRKDVVWLATEKAKLENYVMQLEEAGDAVTAIIGPPGSAHWADENQVDAAWTNWTKAKEAK